MSLSGSVLEVELLPAESCHTIARKIHSLRARWTKRDDKKLYTLGAAAYIDAPDPATRKLMSLPIVGNEKYYGKIEAENRLLREHFSSLYEALCQTLSGVLKSEVGFIENFALPGFHVFGPSPAYASPDSHVPHVDRQYQALDWSGMPEIDFKGAISFTLPIELPACGGGIRVWELDLFQIQEQEKREAIELIRSSQSRRYSYTEGKLFVHRGHALHQIAPWKAGVDDYRITLQGHGLYFGGQWNIYW